MAQAIAELQAVLKMPVLLLIQRHDDEMPFLDEDVAERLISRQNEIPKSPVTLLLDSPGGDAHAAFQIANMLRSRCGEFTVVIPRYAKSAATLLSLGASRIIMGPQAELGPIDVQITDSTREEWFSALDQLQSLDRLRRFGLDALLETYASMRRGIQKKTEVLLPRAVDLVAKMMQPLLEKVDVIQYARMSRLLDVANQYAIRLLQPLRGEAVAADIAATLVGEYPSHEYVINAPEAKRIGLQVEEMPEGWEPIIFRLRALTRGITAVGMFMEAPTDDQKSQNV